MTSTSVFIPTIRAIETTYNGFAFRSRLEARWAVFFDALDLRFNYEQEGFKMPSGVWYLPDFYLPQVRMWAEVKPDAFEEEEKAKCLELVDGTGSVCLLLEGAPDFRTYLAVHAADIENVLERYECDYLLDVDYHGRKHLNAGRLFGDTGGSFVSEVHFTARYREAVHRSRSARFDRKGR